MHAPRLGPFGVGRVVSGTGLGFMRAKPCRGTGVQDRHGSQPARAQSAEHTGFWWQCPCPYMCPCCLGSDRCAALGEAVGGCPACYTLIAKTTAAQPKGGSASGAFLEVWMPSVHGKLP